MKICGDMDFNYLLPLYARTAFDTIIFLYFYRLQVD